MLKLDFGDHPYSLTSSCVSVVKLGQVAPQNVLSITLHQNIIYSTHGYVILSQVYNTVLNIPTKCGVSIASSF